MLILFIIPFVVNMDARYLIIMKGLGILMGKLQTGRFNIIEVK